MLSIQKAIYISRKKAVWNGVGTQVVILTLVNGLVSVIGLITSLKLANTLGIKVFGAYSYFLAIGAYGGAIIRYGRDRTAVRDLAHGEERTLQIIASNIILNIFLFVTAAAVLGVYLFIIEPTVEPAGFILLISVLLLSTDLQSVYDSRDETGRHVLFYAVNRVSYFCIIWLTLFFLPSHLNLQLIAGASIFGVVLSLALQYNEVLRRTSIAIWTRTNLKEAIFCLRSNFPLAVASLIVISTAPTITVFLHQNEDPAELGKYASASQIAAIASFLLAQISRIGNTHIAKATLPGKSAKEQRAVLYAYCALMVAAVMPIAAPMIIIPGYVVNVFYRAEFSSAAPVLPIMGMYIVALAVGLVASQYVIALRYEKTYFVSVLIGVFVALFMGRLLIPHNGAVGAAWTLLLSHCTSISLYVCVSLHAMRNKQGKPTEK